MRSIFFTFIIFLSTVTASSAGFVPYSEIPAGKYELDKTHASLTWKVMHLGLSKYTARFKSFDSEIDFKPSDPTKSKVTATIDVSSITTDYPYPEKKDFDKKLIDEQSWFFAANFPEIEFESTSITLTDEKTGVMEGKLTMLGKTKPVTLNVAFNAAYSEKPYVGVPAMGFSATGELNRSEWGLDTYVPYIGDKVEFNIEAEFHKQQEEKPAE